MTTGSTASGRRGFSRACRPAGSDEVLRGFMATVPRQQIELDVPVAQPRRKLRQERLDLRGGSMAENRDQLLPLVVRDNPAGINLQAFAGYPEEMVEERVGGDAADRLAFFCGVSGGEELPGPVVIRAGVRGDIGSGEAWRLDGGRNSKR